MCVSSFEIEVNLNVSIKMSFNSLATDVTGPMVIVDVSLDALCIILKILRQ